MKGHYLHSNLFNENGLNNKLDVALDPTYIKYYTTTHIMYCTMKS